MGVNVDNVIQVTILITILITSFNITSISTVSAQSDSNLIYLSIERIGGYMLASFNSEDYFHSIFIEKIVLNGPDVKVLTYDIRYGKISVEKVGKYGLNHNFYYPPKLKTILVNNEEFYYFYRNTDNNVITFHIDTSGKYFKEEIFKPQFENSLYKFDVIMDDSNDGLILSRIQEHNLHINSSNTKLKSIDLKTLNFSNYSNLFINNGSIEFYSLNSFKVNNKLSISSIFHNGSNYFDLIIDYNLQTNEIESSKLSRIHISELGEFPQLLQTKNGSLYICSTWDLFEQDSSNRDFIRLYNFHNLSQVSKIPFPKENFNENPQISFTKNGNLRFVGAFEVDRTDRQVRNIQIFDRMKDDWKEILVTQNTGMIE